MSGNNIDVRELLDSRDVSAYQKFIVFISFLIVVMDGFDVVIMGFVGPALKEAWNWTNSDLAPVLSAALFGLTFGALTAGPLGDKFGRRKVLTASVFIFGLFTLLVATASSKTEFIVYRFIAGFAMGGIMPMVATLVKEYSPVKRVSLLVTIVFAGFTVGAAGGGFLAAWMVPHFSWASVFVLGGVLPIITAVVMFFTLPESLTFLVLKGGQCEEICKIVERCAPGVTTADTTFTVPTPPNTSTDVKESPIQIALNSHYRLGSILLWSSYFLHLFLVYLLGSWMPTMIKESGMTTSQAAIISAMFQLGGPLGSVMLGWFMDKFEPHRVITSAYVLGAIMLVVMSNIGGEYLLMCIVAFVIGAGFNGGGTAMNALSSNFFPLPARATGNSWMHGIGRTGAIISAFAGAWMLNAGWNFSTVALALTVPAVFIGILLTVKFLRYRTLS
ncbi:aromatic acid/H+ symport family MFS transporter [Kingella kingae]|uniref:MFS transporter n=1 Tax=Kingella kingae TaxID=504 RepID=UPI0002E9522E|nr:aromatic acid/H+ symport family MFS transporter [Kingella kingae]MDK4556270.1 aromatic acid/H+ symport family MFS transporter [Kingella kingae]MDK4585228.1 aromatic acid/H+ symport family MFS transporter [Kingella kingae]MDK4589343.1 aromatic acid/H+ symport family MFS transporter [Kingella kingae]MDK4597581.1 aromatic acid/H+ symport family MFS transporter [Kingella kingae]MDK4601400.1 aromatic acid/H+ symport family MFS transporter [Kingella kingae]